MFILERKSLSLAGNAGSNVIVEIYIAGTDSLPLFEIHVVDYELRNIPHFNKKLLF